MNTRTSTLPRPCSTCGSLVANLHALYCPRNRAAARKALARHLLAMPNLVGDALPFGGSEGSAS